MTRNARDEHEAARWAVRLDASALSPEEQAELEQWLVGDERRRGALLRAQAVLAYLDRGRALSEAHDGEQDNAEYSIDRRRLLVGGSLAALSASGVAAVLLTRPAAIKIQTAVGEVRRVPLPDGSAASVNTNSALTVAMRSERREINLEQGEAWFQVSHDRARPFVVQAGEVRVQAVGTAFSVRRRVAGADVLVTEGVVDTWTIGRESERTRLVAGERTFVPESAEKPLVEEASDGIDRSLAWRTGELALEGETLDYAVAEINRYNARKLVVADPALGREPLVGYFRTDQPESFAQAVAAIAGARVDLDGRTIRLFRQHS